MFFWTSSFSVQLACAPLAFSATRTFVTNVHVPRFTTTSLVACCTTALYVATLHVPALYVATLHVPALYVPNFARAQKAEVRVNTGGAGGPTGDTQRAKVKEMPPPI